MQTFSVKLFCPIINANFFLLKSFVQLSIHTFFPIQISCIVIHVLFFSSSVKFFVKLSLQTFFSFKLLRNSQSRFFQLNFQSNSQCSFFFFQLTFCPFLNHHLLLINLLSNYQPKHFRPILHFLSSNSPLNPAQFL